MTYDWTMGEPVPEYDSLSCDCCQENPMSEHSPLPWRADREAHGYMRPVVADSNSSPIAILYSEADAAFIVRAVNCHEQMIEALEYFVKVANAWMLDASEAERICVGRAIEATATILAKAKGEA